MHQLENGYTKIANSLLEELARQPIPMNPIRVILWVIRNSYGFNRKHTNPTTTREIGKVIKMGNSSVIWAIRVLLDSGILKRNKDTSFELVKNKIHAFNQPIGQPILTNPLVKVDQPIGQEKQPIGQAIDSIKENLKETSKESEFMVFYKTYPRKIAKANALKAWIKHSPPLNVCLEALRWQIQQECWKKENGKFIPHPATWINGERWQDEPLSIQKQLTPEQREIEHYRAKGMKI